MDVEVPDDRWVFALCRIVASMALTAFALNCSLKSSTESSGTDKLIGEVLDALESHGVSSIGTAGVWDCDIRPGVSSDERDGDEPTQRHCRLRSSSVTPRI
jgi:hypothetical protein